MHGIQLAEFVEAFARGIERADAKRPSAVNVRSKQVFRPGIGPHSEADAVALVMGELAFAEPARYRGHRLGVPYPRARRQRCDVCLGTAPEWEWAIEVKLLRFLGDNGLPNDNMLMHILSPYPVHRSALTDCRKLRDSGLARRYGVLVYAFNAPEWPVEPALNALEVLARAAGLIGARYQAPFSDLVHPIHSSGLVAGWEVCSPSAA